MNARRRKKAGLTKVRRCVRIIERMWNRKCLTRDQRKAECGSWIQRWQEADDRLKRVGTE